VTAILGKAQVEAGQSFRIAKGPAGKQKIRYRVEAEGRNEPLAWMPADNSMFCLGPEPRRRRAGSAGC
jgi:hypothetical protein